MGPTSPGAPTAATCTYAELGSCFPREAEAGAPSVTGKRGHDRTSLSALLVANLATQCVVCGTTSRPIRPEPWFPATEWRMRLFLVCPHLREDADVIGRSELGFRQSRASQQRRPCGRLTGSEGGPALPRLREWPRCLVAARSRGDSQAHPPSLRGGAVTGAHAASLQPTNGLSVGGGRWRRSQTAKRNRRSVSQRH